jgi:hypothetical protein
MKTREQISFQSIPCHEMDYPFTWKKLHRLERKKPALVSSPLPGHKDMHINLKLQGGCFFFGGGGGIGN